MVEERLDSKRGCGWRVEKGLYLVSSGEAVTCGKLPVLLTICPTCSGGIHFARSWTWVDGDTLLAGKQCSFATSAICDTGCDCPLGRKLGRCGLLWVGEKFYKTPADWTREAETLGVSKRIPAVPRDFVLGKTVVLVAHTKSIKSRCGTCDGRATVVAARLRVSEHIQAVEAPREVECGDCDKGSVFSPGIFSAFIPTAIEYVTKGDETEEDLAALVKRGLTPVRVSRKEQITTADIWDEVIG